jgi:hypothetical protein
VRFIEFDRLVLASLHPRRGRSGDDTGNTQLALLIHEYLGIDPLQRYQPSIDEILLLKMIPRRVKENHDQFPLWEFVSNGANQADEGGIFFFCISVEPNDVGFRRVQTG